MSEKITIEGHGGRIELIVIGYERENASIVSDANWLTCALTLMIGPFTGATKLSVETHDLKSLYDELKLLNQGTASTAELRTDEEVIKCLVTMAPLGHALISGTVKIFESVKAELSFSFESDQSFLSQTIAHLETVIEKFPVKKF